VPYDVPGAEPFAHDGALCSFDTILRGADTARHDLAPQAAGLHAISLGLSANFPDDHAMLERGIVIYDALYAWCRDLRDEVYNWTPPAVAGAPVPEGVP